MRQGHHCEDRQHALKLRCRQALRFFHKRLHSHPRHPRETPKFGISYNNSQLQNLCRIRASSNMSAPPLTIRNLTSTSLELKLLERFQAVQVGQGSSNITKVNASESNITTTPGQPERHHVSITIGPFETKVTDIRPKEKEALRMTFEVQGQRYLLHTPTPFPRSTTLMPLHSEPSFEYTAIHLPQHSHLALFSSAKLESWMSRFRDETPISALSIPGTHNSTTYRTALPTVRCQAVSVKDQLENGVRFLDIRVQPEFPSDPSKDNLLLVHAIFSVALRGRKYFRDLVDTVLSFLDENPTETVIMSVKREGNLAKATDQQLSKILYNHYTTDPSRWFTQNRVPTIGEARNKIVLIRRFALDNSLKTEDDETGYCIDAEHWPDNCVDGTCSSGNIRVQDFYEVTESYNIDRKVAYSVYHFIRAAQAVCTLLPGEDEDVARLEDAKQPLFINFLSAANFWRTGCWPDRIAAKVNPQVVEWLCRKHNEGSDREKGDGSTGIVVGDWVGKGGDWDLVRCIVGMNVRW